MSADSSHLNTEASHDGDSMIHSSRVITRFQLEELLVQDSSGVLFRGRDSQTGESVAIRRFFPFGIDGGGMIQDEETAYGMVLSRLIGLHHPALRSVIAGGCDPVDGMPFLVTEWIEGEALGSFIGTSELSDEAATRLISQALEVCELLSHVLAEEAIWVEIYLQTILVGSPESGREFIFSISPFQCVKGSKKSLGLQDLVTLAEQVLAWTGRIISEDADDELGRWLTWLRKNATTTTLHDASELFATLIGATPPPPVTEVLAKAVTQPPPPAKTFKISLQSSLILFVVVVAGLLVGWIIAHNAAAKTRNATAPPKKTAALDMTNLRAVKLSIPVGAPDPQLQASPAIRAPAAPPAAPPGDGAISWNDHERLVTNNKQLVTVEGVVKDIKASTSGKTIYLLFTSEEDKNAARGGIEIGEEPPEPVLKKLHRFLGKNVRVSGKVVLRTLSGLNRPDVMVENISAVKVVK